MNWGLALARCLAPHCDAVCARRRDEHRRLQRQSCPNLGHGGINFGVAFYGAPAVAGVVIIISFFTAKRRWGIVVPLCGWALLIADVALMAASVAG